MKGRNLIKGGNSGLFLNLLLCFSLASGFATAQMDRSNVFQERGLSGVRQITVDDGLSQNQITCIFQDHLGFIWIGTKDGLNMYDGYAFRNYRHIPFDKNSLSDNYITVVHEDIEGRIWVGTHNGGLNLLDRTNGSFTRFRYDINNDNTISHNHIKTLVDDKLGNLWIGTYGNGLNRLSFSMKGDDLNHGTIPEITRFSLSKGFPEANTRVSALTINGDQLLWIGTYQGIYTLDLNNVEVGFEEMAFELQPNETQKRGRQVIIEDKSGNLLMGNSGGLFIYDRNSGHFKPYQTPDGDTISGHITSVAKLSRSGYEELWMTGPEELTILNMSSGELKRHNNNQLLGADHDRVKMISIFIDRAGTVWLGSDGYGMLVYDPSASKFRYPNDILSDNNQDVLSSQSLNIHSIFETTSDKSFLWLGTSRGLYCIDRERSAMKKVRFPGYEELEETKIYSIAADEQGILWLGTEEGLLKYIPEDQSSILFRPGISDFVDEYKSRVYKVWLNRGDVWILTPNTLARFNEFSGGFEYIPLTIRISDSFREDLFPCVYVDRDGHFWLGADNGLHYFNTNDRTIISLTHNENDPQSLPVNDVRSIVPDSRHPDKYLWLATDGGGLCRFDIESSEFMSFTTFDGLANNMVHGMLSDAQGYLWLITSQGISKFIPGDELFENYSVVDRLQSNDFNGGTFYKSINGEFFIGGKRGYYCFFPEDIRQKSYLPLVAFTSLTIHSRKPGGMISRYNESINHMSEIILKHSHNHFNIEFSVSDFAWPHKNRYAYRFNNGDWVNLENLRSVTFTRMRPGRYLLEVKGSNTDGVWSDKAASLLFIISPPWYLNEWAWILFLLISIWAVFFIRRYEMARITLKNNMKIAALENNKFKELNQLKSKFFANVSHELRTPLTLIKGPIKQMMDENRDVGKGKILNMIYTNTNKLLHQINQLLDLSRLETGFFKIQVSRGNIVVLINGLVMSFASWADQKKIDLKFLTDPKMELQRVHDNFYFDREVIEKVINNLLSNALKFTPQNGVVKVIVKFLPDNGRDAAVEIICQDSGIGIPSDNLPFIYDRFYKVDTPTHHQYEGFGIGLAYVKELVEKHHGEILVESEVGKGTVFKILLPVGRSYYEDNELTETTPPPANTEVNCRIETSPHLYETGNTSIDMNNPWVLIVEDHPEVQSYIRECLHEYYYVLSAASAHEGISSAMKHIPDLIISDVMMPGMDGFEYCNNIKSNDRTSHIPLILLTAKAEDEDRIRGLETGADDYLTKPFNPKELLIRVKNLIDNRRLLREKFNNRQLVLPSEVKVTSRDRLFMERLFQVVEQNIGNELFNVAMFAREAGMSQSQIHRKLKAVVNQSANQFIRSVRMHRAKELLQKNAANISEVAFLVGYSDPGYFSKTFRAFFGVLPSNLK